MTAGSTPMPKSVYSFFYNLFTRQHLPSVWIAWISNIAVCLLAAALVVFLLWRAAKRGHDIKGILSSMIIGASIIIGSLIIANALS